MLLLLGAALPAQAARPVVAVFTLESKKARLSADDLDALSEFLGGKLTESGRYQVVPRSELKAALSAEKKASYKACYADACQIEVGKELAAEKTLAGSISKLGSKCIVTLKLYDLQNATNEAAGTHKGGCTVDDGVASLEQALLRMLGAPAPRPAGGYDAILEHAERVTVATAEASAAAAKDREAREAQIEADWAKVQKIATTAALPTPERLAVVQVFLRDYPEDNPRRVEAEVFARVLTQGEDPPAPVDGMVYVPSAELAMGCRRAVDSECFDNEETRKVNVRAFWIDRLEVTAAEYAACVAAGACKAPKTSEACTAGAAGLERHPINCIDQRQAQAYCSFVSKRLPTEEEWELAAGGTDGRKYSWGSAPFAKVAATNIADLSARDAKPRWDFVVGFRDGYAQTAPVGRFPADASPYGALDMMGNVSEWTSTRVKGKFWAARGGSWQSRPRHARVSFRNWFEAHLLGPNVGVRCAR